MDLFKHSNESIKTKRRRDQKGSRETTKKTILAYAASSATDQRAWRELFTSKIIKKV